MMDLWCPSQSYGTAFRPASSITNYHSIPNCRREQQVTLVCTMYLSTDETKDSCEKLRRKGYDTNHVSCFKLLLIRSVTWGPENGEGRFLQGIQPPVFAFVVSPTFILMEPLNFGSRVR